jgi:hypothetical protein
MLSPPPYFPTLPSGSLAVLVIGTIVTIGICQSQLATCALRFIYIRQRGLEGNSTVGIHGTSFRGIIIVNTAQTSNELHANSSHSVIQCKSLKQN